MADRSSVAFVSLQSERVKEEIKILIKTYANLALNAEETKNFKGIKSDANLSQQVNRIIDNIKIIQKRLEKIYEDLIDMKLENMNIAIDNFYRKALEKSEELEKRKEAEYKKFKEAMDQWQEKAKKI